MTPNEYQKEALRTEQDQKKPVFIAESAYRRRLLNVLMGLNVEAGEAIDLLKKYLFQGHKLDRVVSGDIGGCAGVYAGGDPSNEHRQASQEVSGRV